MVPGRVKLAQLAKMQNACPLSVIWMEYIRRDATSFFKSLAKQLRCLGKSKQRRSRTDSHLLENDF